MSGVTNTTLKRIGVETGGTTTEAPEGAYLSYDGDSIFVATGCNSAFGPVEVGDGTVTIGALGMTRMACAEDLMTWETALTGFLQGELQYTASGDDLTLTSDNGTLTLKTI